MSEVLYRISTQPADAPSEVHADVSPDFDPILEKALAKDPLLRYQTGQEMIAALSEIGSDGAVAEVPAGPSGRPAAAEIAGARPSPWFALDSRWRIAVMVASLVLAFVGVNYGIVALFHGPFARTVRRVERQVPRTAPDGLLHVAGAALVPPPSAQSPAMAPARPAPPAPRTASASATPRPSSAPSRSRPAAAPHAVEHPSGRVRLEVKHRLRSGRVVVLVDGRTVLSKPVEAPKGRTATLTHVLSVPTGRHGIEVRLLEDKGTVLAKSRITRDVSRDGTAVLLAQQRSTGRKDLELDWQTAH